MNRCESFVLLFLSCFSVYSQDYFPLHVNDEWHYALLYEPNHDIYMVSQIVDTMTIAEKKYFVRSNLYHYTGSVPEFDTLRSDNNVVYRYSNNRESVMYDLRCSTEVRDTVNLAITVKYPIDTLSLNDTTLADLVFYFTDYVGMADGQRETWFGENIGIVKEAYFRSAPTLTYAKINGRVVINAENTPIRFSRKKAAVASHKIAGRLYLSGIESGAVIDLYSLNGRRLFTTVMPAGASEVIIPERIAAAGRYQLSIRMNGRLVRGMAVSW